MKMRLVTFGKIDIEGQHYDYDVVIERGKVRKRKKRLSKVYRTQFGHTPLSVEENIPWHRPETFRRNRRVWKSAGYARSVRRSAQKRGRDYRDANRRGMRITGEIQAR